MDKHMDQRNWDALREGQQAKRKRNWNTIRTGLYTAIAVMLVMTAVMGSAWAYFTSYATAKGSIALNLGHEERITEEFSDWQKVLDIENDEDSNPVYVRMRAYSAEYPVTYENNANWTQVGDWMYYNGVLDPGKKLSDSGDELLVQINDVPASGDSSLEDGKTFNVIVVYESTEVQYDEAGNVIPAAEAAWDREVDTHRKSTTAGGDN